MNLVLPRPRAWPVHARWTYKGPAERGVAIEHLETGSSCEWQVRNRIGTPCDWILNIFDCLKLSLVGFPSRLRKSCLAVGPHTFRHLAVESQPFFHVVGSCFRVCDASAIGEPEFPAIRAGRVWIFHLAKVEGPSAANHDEVWDFGRFRSNDETAGCLEKVLWESCQPVDFGSGDEAGS